MAEVFGIEVNDLPEGFQPVEVIVIAVGMDEDANTEVISRNSEGMLTWRAMGLLQGFADSARTQFQEELDDE